MKIPSKKEILKSEKHRGWNDTDKLYDRIWLIPSGEKHDSGYMHIAVVGVNVDYEIVAYPDDISTFFPPIKYGDREQYEFASVRMDCHYPQGILQYHGTNLKFRVSSLLSSIDIKIIKKDENNK
jgi:hypothetical protein